MDQTKKTEQREPPKQGRKPYEPPCVVESATFEGLALGCGQYTDACDVTQYSPT